MPQSPLESLLSDIARCTACESANPPLPHKANPVCIAAPRSRIRIVGQAPGNLVNQSGVPFDDPSGVRLREWLGVDKSQFYAPENFAITPMGFCFPGYDKNKGDLPPRKECAVLWQDKLSAQLGDVRLTLLVGGYAQKAYLKERAHKTLTETVRHWKDYGPDIIPLPHPSWRNSGWIKKHDWFEQVIDHLRVSVRALI